LSTAVTTETLAAISFDQFLSTIKPHLHKGIMRPWVALTFTIAIMDFVHFVAYMLPLLAWF
uniref:Uncharacterized protein n=1 Tax=Amphimedon queenslandica TaxID=400682 RepID=A0A1X7T0P3_AMPQE